MFQKSQPETWEPKTSTKDEITVQEDLVINISSRRLTNDQTQALNKGLNYVPTNNLDMFEFTKDFHKFCRKICMKMYFADKGTGHTPPPPLQNLPFKLKVKSTFDPPPPP